MRTLHQISARVPHEIAQDKAPQLYRKSRRRRCRATRRNSRDSLPRILSLASLSGHGTSRNASLLKSSNLTGSRGISISSPQNRSSLYGNGLRRTQTDHPACIAWSGGISANGHRILFLLYQNRIRIQVAHGEAAKISCHSLNPDGLTRRNLFKQVQAYFVQRKAAQSLLLWTANI